jgi:hypothetical protein
MVSHLHFTRAPCRAFSASGSIRTASARTRAADRRQRLQLPVTNRDAYRRHALAFSSAQALAVRAWSGVFTASSARVQAVDFRLLDSCSASTRDRADTVVVGYAG